MKTHPLTLASLAVLLATGLPAHADDCYILKNAKGETVYNSETPPFDLSYPPPSQGAALSRARGEHLIIVPGDECYRADESARRQEYARVIAWERRQAAFVGDNGTRDGASFPPAMGNAQPGQAVISGH